MTAAAAVLLLAAGGPAQRPLDAPPPTTLYLVLRTGQNVTDDKIVKTLETALRHIGASYDRPLSIKAVSGAFVEEFEALSSTAPAVPEVAGKDGPALRLLPTRDTLYEIRLPAAQTLTRLKVTYRKPGEPGEQTRELVPGKDPALTLIASGRYAFAPEPGEVMVAYEGETAEVERVDGKVRVKTGAIERRDWPKTDKFYVVTIRNFVGGRQALFSAIQDSNVVANPFDGVRLANDLVFAFASLERDGGTVGSGRIDQNNRLTIEVETIPDRNPARVWVYFPVQEKDLPDVLAKYRKAKTTELPDQVRADGVPVGLADPTLGPGDAPKWYELPPVPTPPGVKPPAFRRQVRLTDLPGLFKEYPKMHMLIVWEFGAGDTREAIEVKYIKDGKPLGVVAVREREMEGWVSGIQNALNNKKP